MLALAVTLLTGRELHPTRSGRSGQSVRLGLTNGDAPPFEVVGDSRGTYLATTATEPGGTRTSSDKTPPYKRFFTNTMLNELGDGHVDNPLSDSGGLAGPARHAAG